MRLRDYIDIVEGRRIDELSTNLIKTAQAKRYAQLQQKSETGKSRQGAFKPGGAPTKSSLDQYHDSEHKAIERDHKEAAKQFEPYDSKKVAAQQAENERERGRSQQRGKSINTATKKLNGTAKVAARDEVDEGLSRAIKGAALGAAALAGSHSASATPASVDPEIVAASGDTRHVDRKSAKADKEAPKKKRDPKEASKKFHLDLK